MTADFNSHTPNTNKSSNDKSGLGYFLWDTLTGLCCYAVFCAVIAAVYVGVFGYGLGSIIFYSFSTILMMPVSQHECFIIGLIPIVNIIVGCAALWVLMWALIITVSWKAFIWLLSVLPGWLDAWAKNIKR